MKKPLFFYAVSLILISSVFGLRQIMLKNKIIEKSKGLGQLVNEEIIKNLKSWTAINGYAAAISLTIGFLLIIWLVWAIKAVGQIKDIEKRLHAD